MGLFNRRPKGPTQQELAEAELLARTVKFTVSELSTRAVTSHGSYLNQKPLKEDTERLKAFVSGWADSAVWEGVAHLRPEPSGQVGVWVGDWCIDHLTDSAAAQVAAKISDPVPVRVEVQRIGTRDGKRYWGNVTLSKDKRRTLSA